METKKPLYERILDQMFETTFQGAYILTLVLLTLRFFHLIKIAFWECFIPMGIVVGFVFLACCIALPFIDTETGTTDNDS